METITALLPFGAGNSPVTGEFPSQRPVIRIFDVFFDLHLNKRLSKQSGRQWFEMSSRSSCHCNARGMGIHGKSHPKNKTNGPVRAITYFSYSALSTAHLSSSFRFQSRPCLHVVSIMISSPLCIWYKESRVSEPIPTKYRLPLNTIV